MTPHSPKSPKHAGSPRGSNTALRGKSHRSSTHRPRGQNPRPQGHEADARESVASLLGRLGTPPEDLANELSQRFEAGCQSTLASGILVKQVRLNEWAIGPDGTMVYIGPERLAADELVDESTLCERLNREFAELISGDQRGLLPAASAERVLTGHDAHRGGVARIGASSPDAASRTGLAAQRGGRNDVEETDPSKLTRDEQKRRDELISLFTESLADRFGEEAIAEPAKEESGTSPAVQAQPLQADRRFNWNLVLGFGTAVVVSAMIWTGFKLNAIRQENARIEQEANSVSLNKDEERPRKLIEKPRKRLAGAKFEEFDEIPEEDQKDFGSVDSAFDESNEIEGLPDLFAGMVDDIVTEELWSPTETADPSAASAIESAIDPEELRQLVKPNAPDQTEQESLGDLKSLSEAAKTKVFPKITGDAATELGIKTAKKDQGLQQLLEGKSNEPDGPENAQGIRPAQSRFVRLPAAKQTDQPLRINAEGVAVESLEFPSEIPIELSASGEDKALIATETGIRIAGLSANGESTTLAWTEEAKDQKVSSQLVHGRLIDANGDSIYLRPSIETDAFQLSLNPRHMRPSWKLGAPIHPNASRLELDLEVPESLDLAWVTPFNPTRPRRGTAVAVLTPKDGETVSLAIKITAECDRKLTCRIQFAGRLDDTLGWMPLTGQGLLQSAEQLNGQDAVLQSRIEQSEGSLAYASLSESRFTKRRIKGLKDQQKELAAIRERMTLLALLAMELESSVKLRPHLYVQWPGSERQTILQVGESEPAAAEQPQ